MSTYSKSLLGTVAASAVIDERFTRALSALHGVSLRDVMLMRYVQHSAGSKLSRIDLARKLCVSPSTVTRSTRPLEKIGLIERESDMRDGRLSYVVLTRSGKTLLRNAEKAIDELSEEFVSNRLSRREVSDLASILQKLIGSGR